MTKFPLLLASAYALAISAPAFAADKEVYNSEVKIEKDAKGNFSEKDKTTKTSIDGTYNSFEKHVDISADSTGNINKSTTTETMIDPKGLGNKQVTKTKDIEKNKNGDISYTHEATVNGKDVSADSSFERDANGNYERKDTISRVDSAGTAHYAKTDVKMQVDANGDSKKTSLVESSTDPKGLGNKTSVKTTDTEKVTEDQITATHEKKVNGDVVDKSVAVVPAR